MATIFKFIQKIIQNHPLRPLPVHHPRKKITMSSKNVYVVGVGLTKFRKPGVDDSWNYPEMALEAGTMALKDAGIDYSLVKQACVGYVFGGTTCGQRAIYELGLTGIPVYNVNNACSTGSTALMMARQLVEGGISDCVLALGFEKMERHLNMESSSRTPPLDKHMAVMAETCGISHEPMTAQLFGQAGIEHMNKYGTTQEHFAKIAMKNHKHSVNNPYSQMREEYSLQEVLSSKTIFAPLTKLQCCPTSDGAGAAVLCSEEFVQQYNLQSKAVKIVAQAMATDLPSTFNDKSMIKMIGSDMTKKAASEVFKKAGVSPDQVDVVELHDCFATNELLTYEALGLCEEGKGGEMVDSGNNTYGGKYVVNPSGGLISKGHPLGATGLAQCAELCWQLRGEADKRQVVGAKLALQHNLGLGGATVVTLYKHGFPSFIKNRISHPQPAPASGKDSFKPEAIFGDIKPHAVTVGGQDSFKSAALFDEIKQELSKDGSKYVKKINGIFRFDVKNKANEAATWIVDVKNGNGAVSNDANGKGDVTITIGDEDLLNLMMGKLNPQQAFFQGKLKIKGNMALAMKLKELQLKPKAKL